jgi:hypothetical protein
MYAIKPSPFVREHRAEKSSVCWCGREGGQREPRRAKAQSDLAAWKAGKVASFEMPLARLGVSGRIAIIAYTL